MIFKKLFKAYKKLNPCQIRLGEIDCGKKKIDLMQNSEEILRQYVLLNGELCNKKQIFSSKKTITMEIKQHNRHMTA